MAIVSLPTQSSAVAFLGFSATHRCPWLQCFKPPGERLRLVAISGDDAQSNMTQAAKEGVFCLGGLVGRLLKGQFGCCFTALCLCVPNVCLLYSHGLIVEERQEKSIMLI